MHIINNMKTLRQTIACVLLGLALSACGSGIDPLEGGEILGGPGATDLRAEVWYQAGSYKSVLNWDAISGADSYNLFWAGDVTYADLNAVYSHLSGIAEPISLYALQMQLDGLGFAITYGDATIPLTDYEHLDLSEERSYCYVVTGMAAGEPVGSSDVECISTLAIPPVTTSASSGAVTVTWLPVDGAVKYYVFRTISPLSPSINASKAVLPNDSLCEGVKPDVFVGDTTELSIHDDDNGQSLSNCLDYCYTVVPEDAEGNLMNGDTQWRLAQPITQGILDPSFGAEGMAIMNGDGEFGKVALTADEDIITILYIDQQYAGLVKFRSDGSQLLWQSDNLMNRFDVIQGVALGEDGSGGEYAIVTGYKDIDPDIMVYDARMITCKLIGIEGSAPSLDTTFGPSQNGCYQSPQSWSRGHGITLDSSGRILIAGMHGTSPEFRFTVWRLTSGGLLDATFANGGMYSSGGAQISTEAQDITTVQAGGDERIVAIGYTAVLVLNVPQDPLMKIELLSGSGSPLDAETHTPLSGGAYGRAVAASSDGMIVVTGTTALGAANQVPLWDVRMTQGGSALSAPSAYLYDYDNNDAGEDVIDDCRGKPVVAGTTGFAEYATMFALRVDDAFALDVFGNQDPVDGWFIHSSVGTPGSPLTRVWGIVEDVKGRLILSGIYSSDSPEFYPAVWRLK